MRSLSGASLTLASLGLAATIGCSQVGMVQGRRDFKAANAAYQQQDYKRAAELYEQTLKEDPTLSKAYFYLANSYDNQFKPSRKGEAANDALLEKAVANYQLCADKLTGSTDPIDKQLATRSLEYLQAAYGADKLNDPGKAEPIVQKMIQTDPSEPANYFVLAKLYEDAGAYPEAEQTLINAKAAKPNDPAVYMTLAGYYNRQGQFDKTIDALEQRAKVEPTNPEAFQTIAAFYWDETRGDSSLADAKKREYILKGVEAADKALSLKTDFVEALTFKGLLLRQQALVEKDPAKQQELVKQGTALGDRANELRKAQAPKSATN